MDLNDLIQFYIKVEQQILRKGSSRKESSYSSSYPKKEYKKEREDSVSKNKTKETSKSLGKYVSTSQPRSRDIQSIKCLGRGHIASRCPNRRTMIVRGRDEYGSQDDESSVREEKEKSGRAYPYEGELLMIRRTLNNQPSLNHETQRENNFHTGCKFLKHLFSHCE